MSLLHCKEILLQSGLASELALLCGILLLCILSFFAPGSSYGIGFWVALFAIGTSFFLSQTTPTEGEFYSITFDFFTGYLKKVFGVMVSVALFSFLEWKNGRNFQARTEILILLLISQLSLSILVQAKSLWLIFLAAETFSVCAFALARPLGTGKSESGSILKYFATGSIASAIGIFGLTWILGFQGTALEASNDILSSAAFFPVAGSVFFVSFLLFKLGAFPFHFWVPEVFEQAPTPFAGYLASAPKLAAAFALLHVVAVIEPNVTFPLIVLAFIGSFFGNLAALGSKNIKNLLAFSGIGQAGFLLIPAIFSKQISGSDYHLLIFGVGYSIVIQAAFCAVQYFENHLKDNLMVKDLAGQFNMHPLPSILFIVLLVSLIGLPPTIGFTGKLLLFSGILGGSNLFTKDILFILYGLGIGTTILSLSYYLMIPYFLIFKDKQMEDLPYRNSSASLLWIILASLFAILSFFSPATFIPML